MARTAVAWNNWSIEPTDPPRLQPRPFARAEAAALHVDEAVVRGGLELDVDERHRNVV